MALVEHERDAGAIAQPAGSHDLVHDPEQLERVGRTDHEVVVGVEPGIEVEPSQPIGAQERRHDELDVGAGCVVAGVHDDLRLRPGGDALDVGGAPVRHVHRVERRLEELVLEQHPLIRSKPRVDGGERLGQPILASPDVVLARVVRPVREPQLQVARARCVHDVDAGKEMVERLAAHPRIRIAHAAEHVVVVLEDVRVDRPEADAGVGGVPREIGIVVDPVPRDVEGDAGGDAREGVDLGRVRDLLVRAPGHTLLGKDLEAGPGIAEGPRRQLDPLGSQRRDHVRVVAHGWIADHVCLRRSSGQMSGLSLGLDPTRRPLAISDLSAVTARSLT